MTEFYDPLVFLEGVNHQVFIDPRVILQFLELMLQFIQLQWYVPRVILPQLRQLRPLNKGLVNPLLIEYDIVLPMILRKCPLVIKQFLVRYPRVQTLQGLVLDLYELVLELLMPLPQLTNLLVVFSDGRDQGLNSTF